MENRIEAKILHSILIVTIVFLCVIIAAVSFKCHNLMQKLSYTQSVIEKVRETYQVRSGKAIVERVEVSYRIMTVDGGHVWYAITKDKAIIGLAQNVYPGLLEQGVCLRRSPTDEKVVDMTTRNKDALSRLLNIGLDIEY